jgi:SnoaL-like domain
MEKNSMQLGEEYYTLVGERNVEGIKKFLHPDVQFQSPLATLKGKDAVVEATSGFMKTFQSLTIRAKFGAGDQAMIVYDLDIPGISPSFPGASLLTFRDGKIIKIELFFDAALFKK